MAEMIELISELERFLSAAADPPPVGHEDTYSDTISVWAKDLLKRLKRTSLVEDRPGAPVSARCVLSGCRDFEGPAVKCLCKELKSHHCPLHLQLFKFRYGDGTFARAGFAGRSRFCHGSATGKAWTSSAHLKNAMNYWARKPEWWDLADKAGCKVLKITPTGVTEMGIREFMEKKPAK